MPAMIERIRQPCVFSAMLKGSSVNCWGLHPRTKVRGLFSSISSMLSNLVIPVSEDSFPKSHRLRSNMRFGQLGMFQLSKCFLQWPRPFSRLQQMQFQDSFLTVGSSWDETVMEAPTKSWRQRFLPLKKQKTKLIRPGINKGDIKLSALNPLITARPNSRSGVRD